MADKVCSPGGPNGTDQHLRPLAPCADPADASRESSLDFVLKHLHHCRQHHSKCAEQDPTFQPTRLVNCADDTGQLLLVEQDRTVQASPSAIQYVALSYCWGASGFFKTTRTNIDRLKQGFDLSDLPKTLQDAIAVTRQLGIPYIWIDALCIVQGDAADWEKESGTLADVYSNAYFTLAALSAATVTEGFLHLRRSPVQLTRTCSGESGVPTVLVAQEKIRTGLHASSLQDDWNPVLGTQEGDFDPVQKRGWCFQEELLSRRFVAYSRQEIQWSCRTETSCQCRPLGDDGHPKAIPKPKSVQEDPFRFWAEMVPFYSQRALTFPKDKLPAISGLARQVQRLTSADYIAGIWLQDLKRSLNWKLQDDVTTCPPTYRAPSFSWASIDSPVLIPTTTDTLPDIISVMSWDVEPKRQDLLGEIKHASLTVSGFVLSATITYNAESLGGFDFRVAIAGERVVLEEDTHLVRFQVQGADGSDSWSVRRSKEEVKHSRGEWGSGVAVRALCLSVDDMGVEFLVLGQSPENGTELERIGSARFTTAISFFEDFVREVTRDCHRQTITLV